MPKKSFSICTITDIAMIDRRHRTILPWHRGHKKHAIRFFLIHRRRRYNWNHFSQKDFFWNQFICKFKSLSARLRRASRSYEKQKREIKRLDFILCFFTSRVDFASKIIFLAFGNFNLIPFLKKQKSLCDPLAKCFRLCLLWSRKVFVFNLWLMQFYGCNCWEKFS